MNLLEMSFSMTSNLYMFTKQCIWCYCGYQYLSADCNSNLQTVASNTLWPQYEIVNEDEPEVDTEMSDNNGYANALVSGSQVDDGVKSLLESFEVWILVPKYC